MKSKKRFKKSKKFQFKFFPHPFSKFHSTLQTIKNLTMYKYLNNFHYFLFSFSQSTKTNYPFFFPLSLVISIIPTKHLKHERQKESSKGILLPEIKPSRCQENFSIFLHSYAFFAANQTRPTITTMTAHSIISINIIASDIFILTKQALTITTKIMRSITETLRIRRMIGLGFGI